MKKQCCIYRSIVINFADPDPDQHRSALKKGLPDPDPHGQMRIRTILEGSRSRGF